MLATVRNRRSLVAEVEPFDSGPDGQTHLVRLEYIDSDGPSEDSLIWEREVHKTLLEPTALPPVERSEPMTVSEFEALQRATRWTALSPYLSFDRSKKKAEATIASPFFGAVQVEDFQLVPLLKALQMPRISLLLADDVGLGKTVEAGLILSELLLRRRIRQVLILCPAALRNLSALAGEKGKEFMMVGDANQRIYQGRFSFKSLGINIQGRSHILKVNYRTTEQIRCFANNLITEASDDLNGGRESRKGTVSLLQGPRPTLKDFSSPEKEAKFVASEVQKLMNRGLHADEIGVFARTKYLFKPLKDKLKASEIPFVLLDSQNAGSSEAVHIGSMHRSKGLEFKAVFAIQVSADSLPLAQALNNVTDKRAVQDSLDRERHLLYVTATRARDFAYISWTGQPSQFIGN